MDPAVRIKLVRENLALAIALWGAAQKGVITAGFVPNRTELVTADGRVVKVLAPLEVHDTQELVRCVNNQVRGAFAFSAIQTNRVLESLFGNSPVQAAESDLQSARCILYLLSKAVSQDLMAPTWVCPPEYRRRFGIQAVSFVLDASQLDGKKLYWDDFGGLTRYLDLLEYCSVEAEAYRTGGEVPDGQGLVDATDSTSLEPLVAAGPPQDSTSGVAGPIDSLPEKAGPGPDAVSPDGDGPADSMAAFVEACCIVDPQEKTIAKDLYDAYLGWCRDWGLEPLAQRSFGMGLTALGFQRRRRGRGRHWWLGIGLAETPGS